MPLKLRHIALTLCYLMAWLFPLVHEHEVAAERAEHRLCLAEYGVSGDVDEVVFHRRCQHQHHDHAHCAVCQSGQSVRQGFVLVQKPVLPMPQANPAAISHRCLFHARQLLWHAIQPRAP